MLVPILMGSKVDMPHAEKIANHLKLFGINPTFHVASAHKVPEKVIEIINKFNQSEEAVVYITIAGRSNGLSGVVSGSAVHPVIACPPFKDRSDYLVNIHSTIVMPSDTPVMTVIDPQNAAMSVVKIFALTDAGMKKKIEDHIAKVKVEFE